MANNPSTTQIYLDTRSFEEQISDFKNAGEGLDESTSSVSNPSQCKGLVLSQWVDIVREVGKLVSEYKKLIAKDVVSLKDSQKAIEDADRDRARKI